MNNIKIMDKSESEAIIIVLKAEQEPNLYGNLDQLAQIIFQHSAEYENV